jgi:hypothetical protein
VRGQERSDAEESGYPSPLRGAAVLAVLAASLQAVASMLWVGLQKQPNFSLLILMAIWVLCPFVLLLTTDYASNHWLRQSRLVLHKSMLTVSAVSIAAFALGAAWQPRGRGAAPFVAIPILLWFLMAIVAIILRRGHLDTPNSQ